MWDSSRTRAQTRVPCIGRWILNHCATREAQPLLILKSTLFCLCYKILICTQRMLTSSLFLRQMPQECIKNAFLMLMPAQHPFPLFLAIASWFCSAGTTPLIWDTIWWDLNPGAHNPLLKAEHLMSATLSKPSLWEMNTKQSDIKTDSATTW